ncbi:MAG: glycerate kinase [Sutterellaceae bacterium]|nr:glycerate kinase [Sutterellaceae bacterium]MDD7442850.1 glycerate kinase [Sutterellaceae bacterium]MDY2868672.1 glycerate kinase [Mesosutterella sp.]
MRAVVAINAFKGSLTSEEAGRAAADGILEADPEARIRVLSLADGGDGTRASLVRSLGGEARESLVTGPLGSPVRAKWAVARFPGDPEPAALIDAADTSGLVLVPPEERNPLRTTTRGLGELILDARKQGIRSFVIGLGGSATNDCGIGMLGALGFDLRTSDGTPAGAFGRDLGSVASIGPGSSAALLTGCRFRAACDVRNPLTGPDGASLVFGPQKGGSPDDLLVMDRQMERFAHLAEKDLGADPASREAPGSGAAGGLGYALRAFLRAELVPGTDLILDAAGFDDAVRDADLLVTGEGRIDRSTAFGKAPAAAATRAKRVNPGVATLAVCGEAAGDVPPEAGIDAVLPVCPGPVPVSLAMDPGAAASNVRRTVREAARLFLAARRQTR